MPDVSLRFRYVFGAPLSDRGFSREYRRAARRTRDIEQRLAHADAALARLSDKSVGLLQAQGVLVAVYAINIRQSAGALSALCAAMFVTSSLLLMSNLFFFWSHAELNRKARLRFLRQEFKLVVSRSFRFTMGLYLSVAAVALGSLDLARSVLAAR